jgi:hypothetical protein
MTPEVGVLNPLFEESFITGEALTGHLYKPMYLSAERTVKLMTAKDLSQVFVGFLMTGDIGSNFTVASGSNVKVMTMGVTLVVAAGAFAKGDRLTIADSQGRVDTAADNELVVAIAREAASAINHIVSAFIIHCPIKGDNT